MYFDFYFCFFDLYSYSNYKFCNRIKTCAIAAGIKKHKSTIKKNKKKHDKIVMLAESKLSSIEVLTSKALTVWNISHKEFFLINDVLKEYDNLKEHMIILTIYQRF